MFSKNLNDYLTIDILSKQSTINNTYYIYLHYHTRNIYNQTDHCNIEIQSNRIKTACIKEVTRMIHMSVLVLFCMAECVNTLCPYNFRVCFKVVRYKTAYISSRIPHNRLINLTEIYIYLYTGSHQELAQGHTRN